MTRNTTGVMRPKGILNTVIACAIILVLSSCGLIPDSTDTKAQAASPSPTGATSQLPDLTVVDPEGYDEWVNWASSETLPEMQAMADVYGLDEILVPKKIYVDGGFIGISQLGEYCVVAFSSFDNENMDATIMSRYNISLMVVMPSIIDAASMAELMDKYRPFCTTADRADWPPDVEWGSGDAGTAGA